MNSKPSKSSRKREHLALQTLGERLIALTREQLTGLNLDDRLLEAVVNAKSMRAHGALRRQKQLLGKLMREVDPAPIRTALDAIGRNDQLAKRIFREAEEWRERITGNEPDALAAFAEHLGHRCESLETELKAYRSATTDKVRKASKRRIFHEIHREIGLRVQNAPVNI